jgi:cation diffusion facilitator CzcD-associated flavoprotein CzcO
MEERSIDESRRLRVIIIGAGISGILSCIRFKQRIPNIDLRLYDKNAEIGGTWFENRYPGCACGMWTFPRLGCNAIGECLSTGLQADRHICRIDIPAHTYQATFEPNKEWSTFYAKAPEILQYWKHVAEKYGCMKYIKLGQQVTTAIWDEDNSNWYLKVSHMFHQADWETDVKVARSRISTPLTHTQINVTF